MRVYRILVSARRLQGLVVLSGLACLAGGLVEPTSARACGGFFCSRSQPVDQSAERIIFVDSDDGTVTALVQIFYQGPAEKFSWILPVPGVPTVGISSNTVFSRLDQQSRPRFELNETVVGTCKRGGQGPFFDADGNRSLPGGIQPVANEEVSVVGRGSVGPYDYEVISVDASLADVAEVAVNWLSDNGYDITAIGPDLLRAYLEAGMNLIAFRLQKDSDAGDIRPISLTYNTEKPMIPIKLTAVAAQQDMRVVVWHLAKARSVPVNYRSLVINEALIDWNRGGANYQDVVSRAADEAGGHGFVTEMAKPSKGFAEAVFSEQDARAWQQIEQQDWRGRERQLVEASRVFISWDGYREVINQHIPDLLACPRCRLNAIDLPAAFDARQFIRSLQESVIEPVKKGQLLLVSRPYITRLFTTLSASEMTADPIFDTNSDLRDYDNRHEATKFVVCNEDVTYWQAPWAIILASGKTLSGRGNERWPFAIDSMPAAERILQAVSSGASIELSNSTEAIDSKVVEMNDPSIRTSSDPQRPTLIIVEQREVSGCQLRSEPSSLYPCSGLLLLFLIWRRRRV